MGLGTIAKVRAFQDKTVEEMRGRFFGRYMGFVRDREDPSKLGRIRVYVPAIMPNDSKQSWLDWCMPTSGGIAVPPLNAPVWIDFEHGQIQYGIYTWGFPKGEDAASSSIPEAGKEMDDPTWWAEKSGATGGFGGAISVTIPADTAKATKPKYPYNKAFKTEGGHIFEIDDSPGKPRLRYLHPTGTQIFVDVDGSVHTHTKGAQYHHSEGDYVVLLGQGATYKVIYPGGAGMAIGGTGLTVTGTQCRLLGRTVQRSAEPI